jgi:hypothetical protein
LNALIAAQVFGKRVERKMVQNRDGPEIWPAFDELIDEPPYRLPVVHYSTDVRMAMDVVAEMTTRGYADAMVEAIAQAIATPGPVTGQLVSTAVCEKALELLVITVEPGGRNG